MYCDIIYHQKICESLAISLYRSRLCRQLVLYLLSSGTKIQSPRLENSIPDIADSVMSLLAKTIKQEVPSYFKDPEFKCRRRWESIIGVDKYH